MVYAVEKASPAEGEKESAASQPATPIGAPGAPAAETDQEDAVAPDTEESATPAAEKMARERDLMATLRARERELDARARTVAKETEQLNFLRAGLEERLQKLQDLQSQVQTLLDRAETQRNRDVKNLIAVYEGMKADTAAKLLTAMEESTALQILAGLQASNASKVLASMADQDPEKAADFSQRLIAVPGM